MKFGKALLGAAALGLVVSGARPAPAATFAAFSFEGPSKFALLADGGAFTVTTNVKFNYVASGINGLPGGGAGFGSHDAELVINGALVAGAGGTLGPNVAQQAMTLTFSLIGNNNAGSEAAFFGKNFLSGDSDTGFMTGTINGTQGNVSSDTVGIGATINYTSDFLQFGVGPRGFSWALSQIKDKASGTDGLKFDAILKNIKAFTSSISGNFDAEPKPRNNVPEPGTMAMLVGMGVAGSLVALRRRAR